MTYQRNLQSATQLPKKTQIEDLRKNEQLLRSLVEHMQGGVLIEDDRRIILYTNKAFCEIFSIPAPPEALIGSDCSNAAEKAKPLLSDPDYFPQRIAELVAEKRKVIGEEIYFADGRIFERDYIPVFTEERSFIGHLWHYKDITERKRAEIKLKENEKKVRRKLDAILSPKDDIGNLELADVIDEESVQSLLEDFYTLTGIPMAVIDIQGKVLLTVGWQEICTRFHQAHPESGEYCRKSSTELTKDVKSGSFKFFKCYNNIWNITTPLIIGGRQLGSLFISQFLLEDEPVEYEVFRSQAEQYGFEEQEYLSALEKLPRCTRDEVENIVKFSSRLANMISTLSYNNIKLSRSLTEQDRLVNEKETLLDNIDIRVWYLKDSETYGAVNSACANFYGRNKKELEDKTLWEIMPSEEEARNSIQENKEIFKNKKRIRKQEWRKNFKGEKRLLSITKTPKLDEEGRVEHLVCSAIDITEQKEAEQKLLEQKAHYESLFTNTHDAIVYFDTSHKIFNVNHQFEKMFGYTLQEVKGRNINEIVDPFAKMKDYTSYKIIKGETIEKETTRYTKSGEAIEVLLKGAPVYVDGFTIGGYAIYSDITSQKRYEEQLRHLSLHDQLTGLYNRSFFEEEMQRLSKSREYPITIICADLDGFKLINDTLGHKKGDEILKRCADILKNSLRKSDILARVGGDEFAVLLPKTRASTAEKIIKRVHKNVEYYNSEYGDYVLNISLGAETAENSDACLDEVFKKADNMMYYNKLLRSSKAKNNILNPLLAALKEKDFISEGHAQRLIYLCRKLGEKAGLTSQQLDNLELLAKAHDLGKVGIPDEILLKEGSLTSEEWKIMTQHPEKGYRIASSSPELSGIADLILKHHERWDGKGYPLGLKGEEIPIECRILAIVDAYDTMISYRPYQKAVSKEEALKELKLCAGTQFDPHLVESFLSII